MWYGIKKLAVIAVVLFVGGIVVIGTSHTSVGKRLLSQPIFSYLYDSISLLLVPSNDSLPTSYKTAAGAPRVAGAAKQTTAPTPKSKVLGTSKVITISYDKLYSLINGYRRENRLSALKAHRALEQSAASKLSDMQQNHYWTHKDAQGRESWYLFEQIGYHFEKAGENLSFGYTTEWKVFEEWQASPEHNAQMLDPEYEHMGLAADCSSYAQGSKKTCIVVLHLGKQKL